MYILLQSTHQYDLLLFLQFKEICLLLERNDIYYIQMLKIINEVRCTIIKSIKEVKELQRGRLKPGLITSQVSIFGFRCISDHLEAELTRPSTPPLPYLAPSQTQTSAQHISPNFS